MERNPSQWHTTYRQFISSALRTSICITAKWLCCCIHTWGIRNKTERILNLMTEEFFKKYKFCGSVNHIKVNECLSESSNSPAHSPSLFGNLPSKVFPSLGDTARDSWDTTAMESPPQQKWTRWRKALQKPFSFVNTFQQHMYKKRCKYHMPCGGMGWHKENKYLTMHQFQLPVGI